MTHSSQKLFGDPQQHKDAHMVDVFRGVFAVLAFACFLAPAAVNAAPSLHRVAVVLVTFSSHETQKPFNRALTEASILTGERSLAAYFREVSYGAVNVEGTIFDNNGAWYTIDAPKRDPDGFSCNFLDTAQKAVAASDSAIDFLQFDLLMIFTNGTISGVCSVGGGVAGAKTTLVTGEGERTMGVSIQYDGLRAAKHEFGHLLGAGHANFWDCADGTVLYGGCTSVEYGDQYSIMGFGSEFHMNGMEKDLLGWFAEGQVQTVTKDGEFTITPLEENDGKAKVIKVPRARDASGAVLDWYYLEYRQEIGFDASPVNWLTKYKVNEGVLIHFFPHGPVENFNHITRLLDMTPQSYSSPTFDAYDAALPLGSTYADATWGVEFSPVARDDQSITVRVRFTQREVDGSTPELPPASPSAPAANETHEDTCQEAQPLLTAKPALRSSRAGMSHIFTVTIFDQSKYCGARRFVLRPSRVPKRWKATIGTKTSSSFTLHSGQQTQFTVGLASPKRTKKGVYTFTVNVYQRETPKQRSSVRLRYRIR